ncbi:hypothetical protein [Catenuloplanes indicus]|uniref:Uncharacterized protein n=1 Tax=Catenuloplanes indicus TaxID=137267 RepID=A0AAE4AXD1_9ACTN|nr:hypothetical protein [Catenuloplanes indicus]MDQ0365641.1 hypothetical protein [Catenuloplanes indicus]
MRALPLVTTALTLALLTGCAASPEEVAGQAAPAGAPSAVPVTTAPATPSRPAASVTPPATASAVPPPAAAKPPSSIPAPAKNTPAPVASPFFPQPIEYTDWRNATIHGMRDAGDATFRNGTATSGSTTCTINPGGVQPGYGHFIVEEPASAAATGDAAVLVECGSDRRQAIVPVQFGYDQTTLHARGFIQADAPAGSSRMTFTRLLIDGVDIVATVALPGGGTEERRYHHWGMGSEWRQV